MNSRRIFAKLNVVRSGEYDYIIAGGGMAGLSLAFYLDESRLLRDRKILIIDRAAKTANDHTWCFWEKEKSAFEEIVFHRWKTLWFHGTQNFSAPLNAGAYEYKMIRAADFYKFVFERIRTNPNIEFLQADVREIANGKVETSAGNFAAKNFIFDSLTGKNYDDPKYSNLRQHFLGWTIETDREVFNEREMTLFDFRIEQKNECRFAYVLPFTAKKALVEFTVFSADLLALSEYETQLKKYISETLKIEKYRVAETERGVIPMSDEPHEEHPAPKIIRIGTAGGYVKPSTGYSFQRAQRRLKTLVEDLENPTVKVQSPKSKVRSPKSALRIWKNYLDSVLLDVLAKKAYPAADVFTELFSKNETPRILKFLDEDTSVREDLAIMRTVPLAPFAKSAIKIAARKLK